MRSLGLQGLSIPYGKVMSTNGDAGGTKDRVEETER